MKFLLLIFLSSLTYAAPDCKRSCDPQGAPEIPVVLRDIRENVTGECVEEVSEIVVHAPNVDDPCTFANIDNALYHDTDGGDVEWMARTDKNYATTGRCAGQVVGDICYIRTNNVYAQGGSARWSRDGNGDGLILSLKQSAECRASDHKACQIPFETAELGIAVGYDDIYDVQDRDDAIVECKPADCYSITIMTNNYSTPGGYSVPIFQMVTVTRSPDNSLKTRLYLNGPYLTSNVTKDGRIGEERFRPELIGKKADSFLSCSEDFSERRKTYFPK